MQKYTMALLCILASCTFHAGEHQFLEDCREKSIKAWSYFYQGLEDERRRDWQAAAKHFGKAATLSPKSSRIYIHLSWSLLHFNEYSTVQEIMQLAEKYAPPNDYLLHFDMGNVYRFLGDDVAAARCYRKTLEIFPKFTKAREALEIMAKKSESREFEHTAH